MRRRVKFGQVLRAARTAKGMTQEAVAEAAGLDRSFYVEVETAVHGITLDRAMAVADALGLPLAELLQDPIFAPDH
jgi:transcriptional regulator with XRE-family HTH domain